MKAKQKLAVAVTATSLAVLGAGVASARAKHAPPPPPAPSPIPTVSTGLAVNVGYAAATVEGTVNSNGEVATYRFDYGTSINYTLQTSSEQIVNTEPDGVDAGLTNLRPNTVYHYRIEATDAWGTSYGADQTFTTGTGTTGSPSPLASFTAIPVVIHNKCGFMGDFNASASLPAEGTTIAHFTWSFGDGSSQGFFIGPVAIHSYHAGTYHVVLTVTDADGTSASASRTISGGSGSPYCN